MSLVREIPFIVSAMPETLLATCSALYTTAATTAYGIPIAKTTADALITAAGETTAFGRVIDRLRFPVEGSKYNVAVVQAWINSTRGSTEADRKLTVGARLQHGDSSGGGDMADYSTANTRSARQYFTTARSTDHASWDGSESTGAVVAVSHPSIYDIRAAKRYLRVAVPVLKNKVTTESSGDEQSRVGASVAFMAGDVHPAVTDSTSPYSTSTST